MQDPKRVTGAVVLFLALIGVGVVLYVKLHAERAQIAEIVRSPDRFEGTHVVLNGKVTGAHPHFGGVLLGVYGSFELDDGTGTIGIHFDDKVLEPPMPGAHVEVEASAIRPEQVSLDGSLPMHATAPVELVAQSIDVR